MHFKSRVKLMNIINGGSQQASADEERVGQMRTQSKISSRNADGAKMSQDFMTDGMLYDVVDRTMSDSITRPLELSEKWELSSSDTDAYTSSHFRVRSGEIQEFLKTHGLTYIQRNNEIVIKYCPL